MGRDHVMVEHGPVTDDAEGRAEEADAQDAIQAEGVQYMEIYKAQQGKATRRSGKTQSAVIMLRKILLTKGCSESLGKVRLCSWCLVNLTFWVPPFR